MFYAEKSIHKTENETYPGYFTNRIGTDARHFSLKP